MIDLSRLTDRALAEELDDAEVKNDTDRIIYAENEIAARLELPLDETEQGFTPKSASLINDFMRKHGRG